MDKRIREQVSSGVFPIRFKPEDWSSGEICLAAGCDRTIGKDGYGSAEELQAGGEEGCGECSSCGAEAGGSGATHKVDEQTDSLISVDNLDDLTGNSIKIHISEACYMLAIHNLKYDEGLMTSADEISFSKDYSKLKGIYYTPIETMHHKGLSFSLGDDDDVGIAQTNNLVMAIEILSSFGKAEKWPVKLIIFTFTAEGRNCYVAVTCGRNLDKSLQWSPGEAHLLYRIEKINFDYLGHEADRKITAADKVMVERLVMQMLPHYGASELARAGSSSSRGTIHIESQLDTSNKQVSMLLERLSRVSLDREDAEQNVIGIDEFYGDDWRGKIDYNMENSSGIFITSDSRNEIPTYDVHIDNGIHQFNHQVLRTVFEGRSRYYCIIFSAESKLSFGIYNSKPYSDIVTKRSTEKAVMFHAYKNITISSSKDKQFDFAEVVAFF